MARAVQSLDNESRKKTQRTGNWRATETPVAKWVGPEFRLRGLCCKVSCHRVRTQSNRGLQRHREQVCFKKLCRKLILRGTFEAILQVHQHLPHVADLNSDESALIRGCACSDREAGLAVSRGAGFTSKGQEQICARSGNSVMQTVGSRWFAQFCFRARGQSNCGSKRRREQICFKRLCGKLFPRPTFEAISWLFQQAPSATLT
jgi:hypothetical protein